MSKPDLTPVTDADQAVEEGIRRTLSRARSARRRSRRGAGLDRPQPRRWIVDPIDGTKNFVRGVPVWATLIALIVDDEVVVGVVSAPAAAAPLVGLEGRRRLDRPVAARRPPSARSPTCAASRTPRCPTPPSAGWEERGRLDDFLALMRRCWRTRAYGDFWSYMLLAEGAVDIAAEPELEVYDMAALDVIVREAGGRFTSLDGTDGPLGRQRAGHQRPPARRGAGVPRLAARRRRRPRRPARTVRVGLRPARPPARVADETTGRRRRPADAPLVDHRWPPWPVRAPNRSTVPSAATPARATEVAMNIGDVLQAKATPRAWSPSARTPASASCSRSLAEHNIGALVVSADGHDARRHRQRARRRTPPAPRRHGGQQHRRRDHDRRRRDLRPRHRPRRAHEDDDRAPGPPRAGACATATSSASSASATW